MMVLLTHVAASTPPPWRETYKHAVASVIMGNVRSNKMEELEKPESLQGEQPYVFI